MNFNTIKKAARRLRCFLNSKDYKTKKNNDGYVYITYLHPHTKDLLIQSGFFSFHMKRDSLIYEHQLIKYAWSGYKAYLNGFSCEKGITEIHHANGDRSDNRPSNLFYVTPEENKLLAQATCTEYLGKPSKAAPVMFNDRGEAIKDHVHYFANLVKITVEATLNIPVPLVQALLQLPSTIYKKLSNWGHNIWINYERTYSNSW